MLLQAWGVWHISPHLGFLGGLFKTGQHDEVVVIGWSARGSIEKLNGTTAGSYCLDDDGALCARDLKIELLELLSLTAMLICAPRFASSSPSTADEPFMTNVIFLSWSNSIKVRPVML